jgi:hypothetical protein
LKDLDGMPCGPDWRAFGGRVTGTPVAPDARVLRVRSAWIRVLRLYAAGDDGAEPPAGLVGSLLDGAVHARSRFRSTADHSRFAVYSVRNAAEIVRPPARAGEHTLVAVREFRRVPLDASSLALTVFTAWPAHAVQVVAALADFVERAVVAHQPGYALAAHSLAAPHTSLLLTAVQDALALGAAASAAFNLDPLLAELRPLLVSGPEYYVYCPEPAVTPVMGTVSPYAV